MRAQKDRLWVVYKMTLRGKEPPMNAVCEQAECDAMELSRPGHHTLVRAGIGSETEAEKLARGTSGDPVRRASAGGLADGFSAPGT